MTIFEKIKSGEKITDEEFNQIYPPSLREAADTHFTPIEIAIESAKYLAYKSGMKILDIGSGAGKFCMIGASCTGGIFYGVEKRKSLYDVSKKIVEEYKINNVELIHANITDIDFRKYDAFYFYNSFFENKNPEEKIDDSIILKKENYRKYSDYVKEELWGMPRGTRLVTYFSYSDEFPDNYVPRKIDRERKLIFLEKVD